MNDKTAVPDTIPPKVMKAAYALVRAMNESGPKCAGMVVVFVFEGRHLFMREVNALKALGYSVVGKDDGLAVVESDRG